MHLGVAPRQNLVPALRDRDPVGKFARLGTDRFVVGDFGALQLVFPTHEAPVDIELQARTWFAFDAPILRHLDRVFLQPQGKLLDDFGGEIQNLRVLPALLKVLRPQVVEQEGPRHVAPAWLFRVGIDQHRVRVRNRQNHQLLLIHRIVRHVALRHPAEAVTPLGDVLHHLRVDRLRFARILDLPDQVGPELRALFVRSAAGRIHFHRALVLPHVVDELVGVLVQLVEHEAGAFLRFAEFLFALVPRVAGHVPHVGVPFLADLFPVAKSVFEVLADLLEKGFVLAAYLGHVFFNL